MADGHLIFDTRIDDSGFEKCIDSMKASIDGVNTSLKALESALAGNFDSTGAAARAAGKQMEALRQEAEKPVRIRPEISPAEIPPAPVTIPVKAQADSASLAAAENAAGEVFDAAGQEAADAWEKIRRILADGAMDARTKAASVAAAMRKAWEQVEGDSEKASGRAGKQLGENFHSGTRSACAGLNELLSSVKRTMAAVISVKAVLDLGKQAVTLASDMQEVQNVVDTAFGDMAYKMEDFADTSIGSFGISRLAAKQTGSVFAAMASGMGLALDTASDMAVALTGLSADMASFYNVSQDAASTALKSVFTGETETLKQFGIVMTETNLEAFALSRGMEKSLSAMTQAEKVQLRYKYVLQQTALAQGDFAKTSGSWANQTRILTEQFRELTGIIGNVLVHTLLPAVQVLNRGLSSLIAWAGRAYDALADLMGWERSQSSTAGIVTDISAAAGEQAALTEAVEETAKAQENALAGFDKIQKLSGGADSGAEASVPSVYVPAMDTGAAKADAQKTAQEVSGEFAEALRWLYENVLGPIGSWTIGEAVPAGLDVLRGALDVLQASAEALEPYGEWLWEHFLQPLGDWTGEIITDGLEGLADVLGTIGDWIREHPDAAVKIGAVAAAAGVLAAAVQGGAFAGAAGGIGKLLQTLGGLNVTPGVILTGIAAWGYVFTELSENWEDICDVFEESGGVFGFISGWLEYVREDVEEFFQMGDFGAAWYAFWEDVGGAVYDGIQAVKDFGENWLSTFEGIGESAYNIIFVDIPGYFGDARAAVEKAFSGIGAWASGRWKAVKDAFSGAKSYFSEKFGSAYSAAKNAFANAKNDFASRWNGIKEVFAGTGSFFSEKFRSAYNGITDIWNGLPGVFGGIWEDISDGAKNGVNWVIDRLNGLTGAVQNCLNFVVDGINHVCSIHIPANVPYIGGTSFGLDMQHVSIPPIPRLAAGTVVPPNYGEFLAVLGDNKREAEVVSPISAMEKAMENVLSRRKPEGGDIHLTVTLDGKKIYKTIVRRNQESIRMTGRNPLAGGGTPLPTP